MARFIFVLVNEKSYEVVDYHWLFFYLNKSIWYFTIWLRDKLLIWIKSKEFLSDVIKTLTHESETLIAVWKCACYTINFWIIDLTHKVRNSVIVFFKNRLIGFTYLFLVCKFICNLRGYFCNVKNKTNLNVINQIIEFIVQNFTYFYDKWIDWIYQNNIFIHMFPFFDWINNN